MDGRTEEQEEDNRRAALVDYLDESKRARDCGSDANVKPYDAAGETGERKAAKLAAPRRTVAHLSRFSLTYGRLKPVVNARVPSGGASRRQIEKTRELRSIEISAFSLIPRPANDVRGEKEKRRGIFDSLPSLSILLARSPYAYLLLSLSLFLPTRRRSIGRYFRSRGCRFSSLLRKKLGEEHGEV